MEQRGQINAWVEVQRLTRHVKVTNPEMRSAFNQEQMFQRLLRALPPAYDTIRDAKARSVQEIRRNTLSLTKD